MEETGADVVEINGPEIMSRKGGKREANSRQAFTEANHPEVSCFMVHQYKERH